MLDQFPDWKLVQDHDAFLNPCDYDPELSPPVQFATYFISETNLGRLKERLSTNTDRILSTTETVCAFLWKHVVKARNIDCELYPETKLSVTVNTRSRMKNPVCSPAYWGNLSEPNAVSLPNIHDAEMLQNSNACFHRSLECPLASFAKRLQFSRSSHHNSR